MREQLMCDVDGKCLVLFKRLMMVRVSEFKINIARILETVADNG
jgi:hypothetical protein